jgi:hypothetical protein
MNGIFLYYLSDANFCRLCTVLRSNSSFHFRFMSQTRKAFNRLQIHLSFVFDTKTLLKVVFWDFSPLVFFSSDFSFRNCSLIHLNISVKNKNLKKLAEELMLLYHPGPVTKQITLDKELRKEVVNYHLVHRHLVHFY